MARHGWQPVYEGAEDRTGERVPDLVERFELHHRADAGTDQLALAVPLVEGTYDGVAKRWGLRHQPEHAVVRENVPVFRKAAPPQRQK